MHCHRGLCEHDGAPCFCGCHACAVANGKAPAQGSLFPPAREGDDGDDDDA